MTVGQIRHFLDIQDYQSRICDGFSDHCLCIRAESLIQLFLRSVYINKGTVDTHLLCSNSQYI